MITPFSQLSKQYHDRAAFDCGNAELNAFLQTKAVKHMQAGISRTMVHVMAGLSSSDEENGASSRQKQPIGAFFTVAPSSISRETLPQGLAKKLPHYPVPVYMLGQLAVDMRYHGQGMGKVTLVEALSYLWRVHQHMPAYAVIVDCVDDAAEQFYLHFGFKTLCKHKGRARLFLPMTTVAKLFEKTSY